MKDMEEKNQQGEEKEQAGMSGQDVQIEEDERTGQREKAEEAVHIADAVQTVQAEQGEKTGPAGHADQTRHQDSAENTGRLGLVMEGGAMRGMFTCGILDYWMEQGLTFDGAVGTSAGATFGCNLKSGQIGRALRYNKKYCRDPRYASFRSLLLTGDMFNEDFCYNRLPFELDPWDSEAFAADPMEFYVCASDVETGRPVYYKCGKGGRKDIRWFQASASMPLAARIVEIGGRKMLDGGVTDSIPVRFMEKMGYEKNVVILTQPKGYVKEENPMMPLVRLVYRDYPEFVQAMGRRHIRYNKTLRYLEEAEAAGRVFVIRPPQDLGISRVEHDPEELERVYRIGRRTAEAALQEMQEKGFCRAREGSGRRG